VKIRLSIRWLILLAAILLHLGGVLLLLAFTVGLAHAQSPDPTPAPGPDLPYNEAEAQAIDRMIMCPVCPAESIDQAQVPLARQMRQIVRDMLAQGATREEILDFFAQRYGQDVLAAPPKSGLNLIAWIFPLAGVAAALGAGALVLQAMSARRADGPATAPPGEDDLEPYLEMVDRELSLSQEQNDRSQGTDGTSNPSVGDVEPRRKRGPATDG
jgi:cytochrome c-type biogenesis protein CcmH